MKRAIGRFLRFATGAASAVTGPGLASAQDDLSCAVELMVRNGIAEIRGMALSQAGGQGTYRLIVHKTGDAGTSNLSQGGRFAMDPGARSSVGFMSVSVEAGSRYEAVLTIDVGGAHRECRAAGETHVKL